MNLNALRVKNAKPGDRLSDGNGLRLDVDQHGNASWVLRYRSPVHGRERYMGLGSRDHVSLADARAATLEARRAIQQGDDPLDVRKAQRTEAKVDAAKAITFETYALNYISIHEAGWKNAKHRQQWTNSLPDHIRFSVTRVTTGEGLAQVAYNSEGYLFKAVENISADANEVAASVFDYLRDFGDISDDASFSDKLCFH